jgi:hypothetical protein
MSPLLVVTIVVFALMARRLADLYTGGHYVCPSCGARGPSLHSPNCPWSRPSSR